MLRATMNCRSHSSRERAQKREIKTFGNTEAHWSTDSPHQYPDVNRASDSSSVISEKSVVPISVCRISRDPAILASIAVFVAGSLNLAGLFSPPAADAGEVGTEAQSQSQNQSPELIQLIGKAFLILS